MPTADAAKGDLEQLTQDHFRDVVGRFASGVTVITVSKDGHPLGTTASAFTSLSVEPPMVLVCMNKTSETGQAVSSVGRFAVNILGEGHPDLAMRFAGKGDKFEGVATEAGPNGEPLLADALATLECVVSEQTTGGTHFVFLAAVVSAAAKPGSPLTYYRGRFGRFEHADDEAAYTALRDQVIARAIPVGEPIDLDALSEQAGIDRNTLYHALSKLTNEGIVARDANGSFEVTAVTPKLMEDALHARAAIQLGVALQRAGTLTPEEIAECEALLDAMDAAEGGPIEDWVAALDAYTDRFVALSGNPALIEAHRRANAVGMISSARHAAIRGHRPPRRATASHRKVLEAMAQRDFEAVYAAIQRRTEGTIRGLRESIEQSGGEI